jgi:hypothetical protein
MGENTFEGKKTIFKEKDTIEGKKSPSTGKESVKEKKSHLRATVI